MSYTMIALIINIVFAVVLVIGFLIGFWRGLKKSTVNLVFGVIGAIVAFFTTPLVTKAILGVQVSAGGTTQSLQNFIIEQLMSVEQINTLLTRVPNLEALIVGLPTALLNVVLFILMTIAVQFVMYIFYKIFAVIFLRNKKNADGTKPKKHRLWGGLVGAVKTLILMVFVFMPFTSLCGLADTLMTEGDYFVADNPTSAEVIVDEGNQDGSQDGGSSTGNIITQNLPQEATDSVKAFHNSAFGFLGGLFNMDDALFDYYANVKIEGQNVKIRSEIENYWQVYDVYNQIQKIGSEGFNKNLSQLDFDKLDPVVDKILDGGLFKSVVADLVADIIKNYDAPDSLIPAESLENYKDILNAVRDSFGENLDAGKYFSHDLKLVYEAAKTLCKEGVIDELKAANKNVTEEEKTNIINILIKDDNYNAFKDVIAKVFDLNLVRASVQPVTNMLVKNFAEDFTLKTVDTSTWTDAKWRELSENLAGVVKNAMTVLDNVDFDTISGDMLALLSKKTVDDGQGGTKEVNAYDLDVIFTNLGELIDRVCENPFFGQELIDKLLNSDKFKLELPKNDEIIYGADGQPVLAEGEKYSYAVIFGKVVVPSLKTIQESNMYEQIKGTIDAKSLLTFIADYTEKKDNQFLVKAILPLTQVEPTKTLLVGDVFNGLGDTINFKKLETYDDWNNDLTQLSTILVTLNGINVGGKTGIELIMDGALEDLVNNITAEKLESLTNSMLLAKSTASTAQNLLDVAAQSISDLVNKTGLTIDLSAINVAEQAGEIAKVMGGFVDVYKDYQEKQKGDGTSTEPVDVALENLDLEKVGGLLNDMKDNALREGEEGVFKGVFDAMTSYIETNLPEVELKDPATNEYKDFAEVLKQWQIDHPTTTA